MTDHGDVTGQGMGSDPDHVLASDDERQAVVARLGDGCAEGRLTLQELTSRAGQAYSARTRAELAALPADLPGERQAPARRSPGVGSRRRWLLGLVGDSGRKGAWDVEDEMKAVAVLGDVTIDLCNARVTSSEITVIAYAILRDVEIIVPDGVDVEISGVTVLGDLENTVPPVTWGRRRFVVKVQGHAVLGDVEVRRPRQKEVRGRKRRQLKA
jgi:hypothetical protein